MIWPYIILSYVTLFLFGLSDNIRGPLLPELIRFFDLNNTVGSFIFAFSSAFGFVASGLTPKMIQRFGLYYSLLFGVALLALGNLIAGSANSYIMLLSGICFFGFSLGLTNVVQNIMVSQSGPDQYLSRTLAGLHSMYGLASLFAPFVVSLNYEMHFDWRGSFLSVSLFGLLILIWGYVFYSSKIKSIEERALLMVAQNRKDNYLSVAHEPKLLQWFAGFILAAYVVAEIMVSSRMAQYVREVHGADLEKSTLYVSLFFLLLLAGRLFFAFVHVPVSKEKLLSGSLILSIAMALLGIHWSPWFFAMTGLTMSLFYPMAIAYISDKFSHDSNSAISKAVMLQGFFVILMHIGVGYLTDLFGIQKALYFGILFLALSGASLFYCHQQLKSKKVS